MKSDTKEVHIHVYQQLISSIKDLLLIFFKPIILDIILVLV